MVKQTDILVIGGGMAGVISAITAVRSGMKPILVRQSYGATSISSGAINLRGTIEWLRRVQRSEINPEPLMSEIASQFVNLINDVGLHYSGEWNRNLLLINNFGTVKETQLCPSTMEEGDLCRLNGANILFVGINGFSDFDANYISRSIKFFADQALIETNFNIGSVNINFPRIKHTANLSPFDLARLFDKEDVIAEVVANIREAVDLVAYTHIAFPPVLGLKNPKKTVEILQNQLGLVCFEILSAPPSVPGFRLQKALDDLLDRYAVEVIHGKVNGFSDDQNRIQAISVIDKTIRYDIQPKVVVLSTGKFISGGIEWNGELKEPIFNLPVCVDGGFDLPSGMSLLLSDQFASDQRLFSAGLKVDGQMHPLAPDGEILYANLFAAGSVISGYNYSQGQGGLGIPLMSGLLCGKNAVDQLAVEGALL